MIGSGLKIFLDDGTYVEADKLALAAGTVGSLRLSMESCSDLQAIRLKDHAPIMYYLLSKIGLKLERGDGLKHFNSLSLERFKNSQSTLFASFYRMSVAPIGLALSSIGLPPILSKLYPPRIVDVITPVQVWTDHTLMTYQIDRNSRDAHLIVKPDYASDYELLKFQKWLSEIGVVLHKTLTPPGFGFHYHDGRVSGDSGVFQNVNEFLKERYSNKIFCTDASILTRIGVRPPSLMAMQLRIKLHEIFFRRFLLEDTIHLSLMAS